MGFTIGAVAVGITLTVANIIQQLETVDLGPLGEALAEWIAELNQNALPTMLALVTGTSLLLGNPIVAALTLFARSMIDPIVLDLGGDGVTLTPLTTSTASFDLHNTGFAVNTGWIGANDAFLVADRNGDGEINSIAELFGSSEVDGFTALSMLDENHDGVINSLDAGFASLQLWVDANSNGDTDAGELKQLAEFGITAIDLAATTTDHMVNGNMIGAMGTYVRADGTTGDVAEAYFANDKTLSRYEGEFAYDPEVWLLPNLRGYGTVPDLWIAMSLDPGLKALVQAFMARSIADVAGMQADVLSIIYRWTGVENVEAGSRGVFIDAQHLAMLENFVGQSWQNLWSAEGGNNPANSHQGQVLEGASLNLLNELSARLLILGPLQPYFNSAVYDFAADSISSANGLSGFLSAIAATTPAELADAASHWRDFAPVAEGIGHVLGISSSESGGYLNNAFSVLGLPITLDQARNNRVFVGSADNDQISGTSGGDFIQGNQGNDTLAGGFNNDTYLYSRGDGHDTITELENRFSATPGGTADKLVLQGISPASVSLLRNGNDVTLVIAESAPGAGDGGSVLLKASLDEYYSMGVDSILFDDGTVWTRADLRLALLAQAWSNGNDVINGFNTSDVITGGAGNDTINAGDGDDLITGGTGNDTIAGGFNNDIYLYSRGDGHDTITELENRFSATPGGTADKLVLQGISPASVSLLRNGNDVTLVIAESAPGAGDGGSVLLKASLDEYYSMGIDSILFDDGTVWAPLKTPATWSVS